jgi:hypothetical protein
MKKLVAIYGNSVAPGEDGLRVPFATFGFALPIARKCQQILPRNRYLVPEILNASQDVAAIEVEAPRERPELTEQCLRDADGLIRKALADYQKRYGDAVAAGRPVRRLHLDSALECLNKTLWTIEHEGGRVVLAPETDFAAELRGIDPQLLHAAEPNEGEEVEIRQALVVGCREIYRNQGDLFQADNEVDVLVSLVGPIPEVQLRTTRGDAQQIYRGANRMTANTRAANRGETPLVVGEYTIGE